MVEEAFPRLHDRSMFFYQEVHLKDTEEFLDGEVEEELRNNFEWAGQRAREKSTASIKEKAEKGNELRVLLGTWILCYARNHETTRALDAYDPYHEATMLTELLEEANGLGKLLRFKLDKRTDIDILER